MLVYVPLFFESGGRFCWAERIWLVAAFSAPFSPEESVPVRADLPVRPKELLFSGAKSSPSVKTVSPCSTASSAYCFDTAEIP